MCELGGDMFNYHWSIHALVKFYVICLRDESSIEYICILVGLECVFIFLPPSFFSFHCFYSFVIVRSLQTDGDGVITLDVFDDILQVYGTNACIFQTLIYVISLSERSSRLCDLSEEILESEVLALFLSSSFECQTP